MRPARLLTASIAALGVATLGNRLVARRVDPLPPAIKGEQHTYRWRGMDVAYTTVGDAGAPEVALFHGLHAAASAREFEGLVDELSDDYRLLVPDLPGFGRSDRPPLSYSGSLYSSFVADFATDLADEPACVASSLSSAYAVEAAKRGAVSSLVLVCPTARVRDGAKPVLQSILRSPIVGTAIHNLLVSEPSIRYYNERIAMADPGNLTDVDVAYQWQTGHQPGAKYPVASFVSGYLDRPIDLGETMAELADPPTLVWGRQAETVPLSAGRALADRADARLVVVDSSKLLPHVEHPEPFADVVRSVLRSAPLGRP